MIKLTNIIFKFFIICATIAIFLPITSAYYSYGYEDYSKTYYEKSSYGYAGYQYIKREVDKNPWGEKTIYVRVVDYDEYKRDRYPNRVISYWSEGPQQKIYLGYGWDDSWRRKVYDTQYHTYYYEPRYFYNGVYYNWHCNSIRYCNR